MKVRTYLQGSGGATTLSEIEGAFQRIDPDTTLMCFAYATYTGCTEFNKRLGPVIWQRPSKWLIGIDYGRTQPSALEFISSKTEAEVRIFDGLHVVHVPSFVPRTDFHLKATFLHSATQGRAVVAGSGNFSANGLLKSVECGVALNQPADRPSRWIDALFTSAEALWEQATPLQQVLAEYKRDWSPGAVSPRRHQRQRSFGSFQRFWIEGGYITPNRGPNREGNQFDMPRGAHQFFRLAAHPNQQPNSVIGDVTFVGNGPPVTNALRLGNNHMERVTLPFPEAYPFGTYTGKIIEFERVRSGYKVHAYELEEFDLSTKQRPSRLTLKMGSGRAYGFR